MVPVPVGEVDQPDRRNVWLQPLDVSLPDVDRKSTRLNSSHLVISYAVFCLKKKKKNSTCTGLRSQLSAPPTKCSSPSRTQYSITPKYATLQPPHRQVIVTIPTHTHTSIRR